jgi:hypothetical protein
VDLVVGDLVNKHHHNNNKRRREDLVTLHPMFKLVVNLV